MGKTDTYLKRHVCRLIDAKPNECQIDVWSISPVSVDSSSSPVPQISDTQRRWVKEPLRQRWLETRR